MRSTKPRTTVARTILAGSLVVLTITGLASCGSPGDVSAETLGGTVASAEAVPEDFPTPPGVVEFDQLVISDEQIHVQWESDRSVDALIEHYDAELPGSGWEILSRREGGASTRYRVEGHGWDGAVTLLGSADPVKVQLQLGRPDGN